MLFPKNLTEKLDFTSLLELLKSYCLSNMGREMVEGMRFITEFETIEKYLNQTQEMLHILTYETTFPSKHYLDNRASIKKLNVEGLWLSEQEFFEIKQMLQTVVECVEFFKERPEQYLNLRLLFGNIDVPKKLFLSIDAIIDEKGKIRINASKSLQDICYKIAKAEQQVQHQIEHILRQAVKDKIVADAKLTIKNGRLVIPVLAEHKRKVKGIIHDQSNTGQTVFIEPAEVFEMNNMITDMYNDKQREIIKVLTILTAELTQYKELIAKAQQAVGIIDFIKAKAFLALQTESCKPILTRKSETRWVNARHPVLHINLKKLKQSVVPLNIYLDDKERIIVISGPNAGGKSIALKTVGILQLMLQYGLLVPADETSKAGIYTHILGDIGDQQSIENDLSTYSAHLSNMSYFLKVSAQQTLFLIDEFGMGTDPQFGGPIAEAIMLELNAHKARGIITTHFSNLKIRAGATQGFCNAAMLFDTQALNPTYILQQGKPGSSYAYEIAVKMGISSNVIDAAKSFSGAKENKVEELLSNLEKDKFEIEQNKALQAAQELKVKNLAEELEKQTDYIDTHKKQLIKDAKLQAKHLIDSANRLIENTITEIKHAEAEKEKTKEIRAKLKKEIAVLLPTQEHRIQLKAELEVGDWVGIEGTQSIGEIISMNKKNVQLRMGDMITSVDKAKCLKTENPDKKPTKGKSNAHRIIAESISEYSTTLDVRGKRADEALFELEKYLDRAIMLNIGKLEVLHGKGDGILRKSIHQYLRKFSGIKQFYTASEEFGGQGITIVEFI